jgi:hypothetical protein
MIELRDIYSDFPEILSVKVDGISGAYLSAALEPLCEEACIYFRAAGIAAVLVEFDIDGFHHMLTRSALTRTYLLERTPSVERDASRYCRISRATGFFDALAIGQVELARRIIAAGPQQRNVDYEYEEDYAYVRFLYGLLLGAGAAEQLAILDDWKTLLDGVKSAKHDVCRALLTRDAAVFDAAFAHLLDARGHELHAQERSISRDEMEFAGGRHVYVEGLAILRIAEMLGIATQPEYKYCPKETRQPMGAPFPDDLYPR